MFKILFITNGAWQELIGHCCSTIEEAEAYIQMSPSSFHLLRAGEDWPAAPAPTVDPRQEKIDALRPETRKFLADQISQMLGDL